MSLTLRYAFHYRLVYGLGLSMWFAESDSDTEWPSPMTRGIACSIVLRYCSFPLVIFAYRTMLSKLNCIYVKLNANEIKSRCTTYMLSMHISDHVMSHQNVCAVCYLLAIVNTVDGAYYWLGVRANVFTRSVYRHYEIIFAFSYNNDDWWLPVANFNEISGTADEICRKGEREREGEKGAGKGWRLVYNRSCMTKRRDHSAQFYFVLFHVLIGHQFVFRRHRCVGYCCSNDLVSTVRNATQLFPF